MLLVQTRREVRSMYIRCPVHLLGPKGTRKSKPFIDRVVSLEKDQMIAKMADTTMLEYRNKTWSNLESCGAVEERLVPVSSSRPTASRN